MQVIFNNNKIKINSSIFEKKSSSNLLHNDDDDDWLNELTMNVFSRFVSINVDHQNKLITFGITE